MIRNPQIAIFLCQLDLDGQFEAFRKSLAFDTAEWRRHRRFFPTGQQVWIATVEIFICFVSKCDSIIKVWCKQTDRHHSRRNLSCFEVISTTFGVPPHPNKSKIGRQMVKRAPKNGFFGFSCAKCDSKNPDLNVLNSMASTGSFCRLPRVYSSLHGRMRLVSAFFAQPVNKSESRLLRFLFPNVTSKSKFDINKLLGIIPDAIWVVLKLIQPALGYPHPKKSKIGRQMVKRAPKIGFFGFSCAKCD